MEALEALRAAATILDRLPAAAPTSVRDHSQPAILANVRGTVLEDLGQLKPAEADYRKAVELLDHLTERFPAERKYQTSAGVCRNNLALVMEADGRLGEAEGLYRRNLKLWEALAARDPSDPDYRSKVALTCDNLAALLQKTGRHTEAEQNLRQVAELRTALSRDFPNTPWHHTKLAQALGPLAKIAAGRGDLSEARRLQEQALRDTRAALAIAPENAGYRRDVAATCAELVETLILLKRHDEAVKLDTEFALLSRDSIKDTLRAGSLLARCVPLVEGDRSLSDARRAELAEAYAKRSIALVREAVARGFRDLDAIRNDRSFDSLRARTDVGSSLASIESPAEAKP